MPRYDNCQGQIEGQEFVKKWKTHHKMKKKMKQWQQEQELKQIQEHDDPCLKKKTLSLPLYFLSLFHLQFLWHLLPFKKKATKKR